MIKEYKGLLELSDRHTLWNVEVKEENCQNFDEIYYEYIVSKFLKPIEEKYNIEIFSEGRSGRHICIKNTPENRKLYYRLVGVLKTAENKMLKYIKENY